MENYLTVHQVAALIGTGFLTKMIIAGGGKHIWCLHPAQFSETLKWSIIAQILNVIGIGLAKISVALCILRIIDRARTGLAIFLHAVIAFVSASHLSQVILFFVQCRPMAAIWNPHIHGTCFSPHVTYLAGYIGFGLDAFTDLICAGIPIVILHRLSINRKTKTVLCCLMGLGSLTAACAIAKAILLEGVFDSDYTWSLTKQAFCTIIEHFASITLVSLPALKPLFNNLLRTTRSSNNRPKRRPHVHHKSGRSTNSYALSVRTPRSADTEKGEASLCNTIWKTTQFHLSSHNSIASRSPDLEDDEDRWPMPARLRP